MTRKTVELRDKLTIGSKLTSSSTSNIRTRSTLYTEVDAVNRKTGEVLFKRRQNKLVLPGSVFSLEKLFNKNFALRYPTLNSILGVDDVVDPASEGWDKDHKIIGFVIGNSGAELTFGDIKAVRYYQNGIENLVPFRYVPVTEDLTFEEQQKYGLKVNTGTGYYAYYMKLMNNIETRAKFADGTDIPLDAYNNDYTIEQENSMEVYIYNALSVEANEVREYYEYALGDISMARYNTLGLVTGLPFTDNGYTKYKYVRPFTVLNFNNTPGNGDSAIDYSYKIFM